MDTALSDHLKKDGINDGVYLIQSVEYSNNIFCSEIARGQSVQGSRLTECYTKWDIKQFQETGEYAIGIADFKLWTAANDSPEERELIQMRHSEYQWRIKRVNGCNPPAYTIGHPCFGVNQYWGLADRAHGMGVRLERDSTDRRNHWRFISSPTDNNQNETALETFSKGDKGTNGFRMETGGWKATTNIASPDIEMEPLPHPIEALPPTQGQNQQVSRSDPTNPTESRNYDQGAPLAEGKYRICNVGAGLTLACCGRVDGSLQVEFDEDIDGAGAWQVRRHGQCYLIRRADRPMWAGSCIDGPEGESSRVVSCNKPKKWIIESVIEGSPGSESRFTIKDDVCGLYWEVPTESNYKVELKQGARDEYSHWTFEPLQPAPTM